jgi:hypothetical protein
VTQQAGAPTTAARYSADVIEIDLTPAMIDAGVDAYLALDRGFDQPDKIVMEVFQAMIRARHEPTTAAALDRQLVRQSRQWWT